ncbi:hypothetical protein PHJA_001796600 [Phtheirospermum japonicum]|uniref:Uncharacterized protein n=1 Tax=Phtheirospermum japonicum TaxID=374723 RepID=A0A830CN90_9LAMI|nr:hypothetical protein PHJA_001796600 [Phtheirospermum japonicum]
MAIKINLAAALLVALVAVAHRHKLHHHRHHHHFRRRGQSRSAAAVASASSRAVDSDPARGTSPRGAAPTRRRKKLLRIQVSNNSNCKNAASS